MERLEGLGLDVQLPEGWDGRIYRRQNEALAGARRALHAANFPLPLERGDYGGGVHETMGEGDVFVSLVEFEAESANVGLFQNQGLSLPLDPSAFSPTAMPRAVPGLAGAQHFFSVGDRAFCLFVVVGSYRNREQLVPMASSVVETLNIVP